MKKGAQILTWLLIFLLIPLVLGIEVTISKESYQPQELFQAQITGNFISLNEDNVFIYQDEKAHPEPTMKGLTRQNNIYYFYSTLPNREGNFSFRIEGAKYLERGTIKEDPFILPINLSYKDESDLSINPGFIIPSSDFEIKVKSLFGNTQATAVFEATGEKKVINLTEQLEETLKFKLPPLPPQKSRVIINDYEIPVFLIKDMDTFKIVLLEFTPNIIKGTIIPNKDYFFTIVVRNPTSEPLENIVFSSEQGATFTPSSIELLEPNRAKIINLTIKVKEVEENFSGAVLAVVQNESYALPINFAITQNKSEVKIDQDITVTSSGSGSQTNSLSCSQLGNICLTNEVCTGDTVESLEGPCCIGSCTAQESSNTSTYAGIALLIILILTIGYIVWKVKKKKNLKSSDQILAEKQEKYKKRMKGSEVNNQLDNV